MSTRVSKLVLGRGLVDAMGGRGGGSYLSARDLEALRDEARRRLEQSRIDAEVNSFLQLELSGFNNRDVDTINRRLEQIESALEDTIESIDRLLFGGSVAKHTYVDGLSDVDSLVLLRDEALAEKEPAEVRNEFRSALMRNLPRGEIQEISVGAMAVTMKYRDGTEIQLLPAVQSKGNILISSEDGKSWSQIQPKAFAQDLSRINRRQGGSVVPAIKLTKAILANRLGERSPSGYHLEAIAVAAFRDYSGPRTPKAMVTELFTRASNTILRPIQDVTGQSRNVDQALGPANSAPRRELSRTFGQIGKMMSASQSVSEWRALFE